MHASVLSAGFVVGAGPEISADKVCVGKQCAASQVGASNVVAAKLLYSFGVDSYSRIPCLVHVGNQPTNPDLPVRADDGTERSGRGCSVSFAEVPFRVVNSSSSSFRR